MTRGIVAELGRALAAALVGLGRTLSDVDAGTAALRRLGWTPGHYPNELVAVGTSLQSLDDLVNGNVGEPADLPALVASVSGGFAAIESLAAISLDGTGEAAGIALVEHLVHFACAEHLRRRHPRVHAGLRFLGFLRREPDAPSEPDGVERERFCLPDVRQWIERPSTLLEAAWNWMLSTFDGLRFLEQVAVLIRAHGVPASFSFAPLQVAGASCSPWQLVAVAASGRGTAGPYRIGVRLACVQRGGMDAIAAVPFVEGANELRVALADGAELWCEGNFLSGAGIVVGQGGVQAEQAPLLDVSDPAIGDLALGFRRPWAGGAIGGAAGALSFDAWDAIASIRATLDGAEFLIEGGLRNARLEVGLPAWLGSAVSLPVPLRFSVSSRRGVSIGAGGLSVERVVGHRVGALRLERVAVSLETNAQGGALQVDAAVGFTAGPAAIVAEDIGVRLSCEFPGNGGNLGPVDSHLLATGPSGFGVAISSAVVSGGGFLARVSDQRFLGALSLSAHALSLTAVGLMELSAGRYSLAAVVGGLFAPVPLPLGFTLDGVGGLIAIHRRVDTDALRAALRRPAGMGEIFFPTDPLAQADRITTDLAAYFPAAAGRHVFGPAVKFGWGTPTMVRGELAVLLELPAPVRVVVLGTVSAKLPTEEQAIVDLNVDVVGEVDFAQKRVAIDASLRNSTIAGFPITGDMAFRMAWGSPPSFALAIGGFHSQFPTPPGFPELRRIQIPLGAGDDPRLDAQGFLALTSNTAQIGARIDLYASAGPLNIKGGLGFETLLTFSPFQLQVDVWAGVALRRGTSTLASIHFDGHLSGPKPWRLDGKACLSLWFVDLCVPIHVSFGAGHATELPRRQIWPALHEALATPTAWASAVPPGLAAAVTAPASGEAPAARLEPCATLTVTQRVVPLGRQITAFAHGRPEGGDRFQVTGVRLGASAVPTHEIAPVSEWFAPAQFEEMSEADKLSRPGFEQMVGGVSIGAATIRAGAPLVRALDYDTVVVVNGERQVALGYRPTREQQIEGTLAATSARPPLRATGAAAFLPPAGQPPRLRLVEETFVIASTDELAPRWDLSAAGTRGQVELALRAHLAANPGDAGRLQVVPSFEVAA